MFEIVLGVLVIYQIYGLIHFVEKTNRDLTRFFQSIQNDDFTQTFSSKDLGNSFEELKKSFNKVTKQFIKLRSEKEQHARYLNTVIKHIGVGLISYKSNGDVELINTAAKRLLNITHLKNIKSLEQFSMPLVNTLFNLKPGQNAALKIDTEDRTMYFSINATQFKMEAELYTLVSLQNIQSEIEREHMAKELEIAWEVQKSLLPGKDPNVPGFDIAGLCIPAKEVGGDYYDFIPAGANRLALIIGDVSGKGTSASFYMTLTKGFIQSNVKGNKSPKEVLIEVNEQMYETIDRRSFVTIFMAVLDWKEKKILCARAGHNPAIHYSDKEEKAIFIKPEGIALGLRKKKEFTESLQEVEIDFKDNDWLILFTDGFVEAMNSQLVEFGENRLIEGIKENCQKSAREMVDTLYEKVNTFSKAHTHHDDMTMIGVKVKK
jgi:serine phosphatase RsbU (regulator of sigma subunit)